MIWLQRVQGRLRRALQHHAVIMMYHRIAELDCDPWGLCVSPAHFAEQVDVLRSYGVPMQFQDVVRRLRRGKLPRRAVIITMDDGHADNLENGRPILDHYGVPATVFVASGYLGQAREFWWDALERCLLTPDRVPEVLRLRINGEELQWEFGDGKEEHASGGDHMWRAWTEPVTARQRAFRSLWELLQRMEDEDRNLALETLRGWSGIPAEARPTHRVLSESQLLALAAGGLVEIAAHTATHPMLSGLTSDMQMGEIRASKIRLEAILRTRVESFAYPYGDYGPETVGLVRQAGFLGACTTKPGVASLRSDPFELPRISASDLDGAAFSQWLSTRLGECS